MTSARISRVWGTIFLTIIISSLSFPAYAKYSGGTGEPNDPYQLATAEDLIQVGETPDDYDKHFILTADIDLDPSLPGRKVFDRAVIAPAGYDFLYWLEGTSFAGVFDGKDHTISCLNIVGGSGLFGGLRPGAEIRNLGVINVSITGSSSCVGGLVGENRGYISRCYSTGTVNGERDVGGLVGENGGEVFDCYSASKVKGDNSVGGLVGNNLLSWLTLSIDPDVSFGLVARCYSTGSVAGTNDVGGLVGANPGDVINSYSTSAVTGDSSVGGLVGSNLLGWVDGLISKCYSIGAVVGNYDVGGLVGEGTYNYSNEGGVIQSFWDIETSGQTISAGGKGLTTSEMQTSHTFSLWGTCGNEGIWTIDEGNAYPRLAWENQCGEAIHLSPLSDLLLGVGTESDPFLITTAEELYLIGLFPCEWDKCFKLMADVDLSSFDGKEGKPAFSIIGNNVEAFTGVFDGNAHTISHLTIEGDDYLGLFGYSSGEIKDLGVVDVNITGLEKNFIGGLVGYNYYHGAVIRCYTTGVVGGGERVGGLVGENDGYVTECYSTGVVTGRWDVGGLVGGQKGQNEVVSLYGRVAQCYSTATVVGDARVGGLVGYNDSYGSVIQCYSTGIVTGQTSIGGLVGYILSVTVARSFWDVETSGQRISAGGTGRTTAEMQTASTFLDAGWDFVDETENGTEDIWWILEGQDYPRLWWELIPEN